jgi:hypothetical protein
MNTITKLAALSTLVVAFGSFGCAASEDDTDSTAPMPVIQLDETMSPKAFCDTWHSLTQAQQDSFQGTRTAEIADKNC